MRAAAARDSLGRQPSPGQGRERETMSGRPRSFSSFRDTRHRTLELARGLTQEQMDHSVRSGKWSVGEVLDHLVRVDELFRDEYDELLRRWKKRRGGVSLHRSLADVGLELPLVPNALRPLFDVPAALAGVFVPRPVRQAIFANRAVPTRAPARIAPRAGRPAADLVGELTGFEAYLERFFADNPGVDWPSLRYYNPLCGFTNLPGILSFVASHERRHQAQIRDILAAEGFPGAA